MVTNACALALSIRLVGVGCSSGTGDKTGAGGQSGSAGGGAGGTRGGATCGATPCGGNLVGTWSFVDTCINESAFAEQLRYPGCDTVTASNVIWRPSGTIAFTGTDYTETITVDISYTETFPLTCVPEP